MNQNTCRNIDSVIERALVSYGSELAGQRFPRGKSEFKSCCRMDHGGCGVIVTVEHGRIVDIKGDKCSPNNRGYMCVKGRHTTELTYNPDRLKYPMKRIGKRGGHLWEPIGWEDAIDLVGSKLEEIKRKYGPEAVAMSQGTQRAYSSMFFRFAYVFGTPNTTTTSHICYQPKVRTSAIMLGGLPRADFDGSPKCIIVWGNNVTTSNSDGMCGDKYIRAVKDKNVKLIVIDPKRTGLVGRADLWLQICPGTDAALALSMLNVIINEKLYDSDFVEEWTVGFSELASKVAEYTPDRVSKITWIPAELIIEASRLYANTKPACIQWGVAIEQSENCSSSVRAIISLMAITGNIDVPGGNVFFTPPNNFIWPETDPAMLMTGLINRETRSKAIGSKTYPIYCGESSGPAASLRASPPEMWKTIVTGKPYPIKALLLVGHNPLLALENARYIRKGFENLEFVAAIDLFLTPSADLADIILPAASWVETDNISNALTCWGMFLRQKIAQMWQAKPDFEILNSLGNHMGYQQYFWPTVEDFLDHVLNPTGMTWQQFKKVGFLVGDMKYRKYEKNGFNTPSGKVELFSNTFKQFGYDPLPSFQKSYEASPCAQDAKKYPLLATSARLPYFFHSENRQMPSLRHAHPEPLIELHPDTAKEYAISEGDCVWIETRVGKIKQKAKLNKGIDPRIVYVEHGWWFPERVDTSFDWDKSNINILTSNELPFDPVFSSTRLRPFRCRIYKV